MPRTEPSPRPWRAEANAFGTYIVGADGRKAAQALTSNANAALIVAAVNERDRLRDLVRRMADLSESLLANYEYRYREDVNSMAFVENTRGFLREARAAIGEDAP